MHMPQHTRKNPLCLNFLYLIYLAEVL